MELDYFRRMPPYRAVKRWLSVGSASIAVAWIAWATARQDQSWYSSGPMTSAHAILADDCGKCHTAPWRGLQVLAAPAEADRVMNEACLRCHGNSIGHDSQTMAALHGQSQDVQRMVGSMEEVDRVAALNAQAIDGVAVTARGQAGSVGRMVESSQALSALAEEMQALVRTLQTGRSDVGVS